jgi:hypothetical protein
MARLGILTTQGDQVPEAALLLLLCQMLHCNLNRAKV